MKLNVLFRQHIIIKQDKTRCVLLWQINDETKLDLSVWMERHWETKLIYLAGRDMPILSDRIGHSFPYSNKYDDINS